MTGDQLDVPEAVSTALSEWAYALYLLGERLRPHTLAEAWIRGLVTAGIRAEHARVWTGKYPRDLPFVVEMPCPFGHRTPDRYDYAKVRLIVEDSGWPSLDPASGCGECTPNELARWLLTCPRCEADEDSDDHGPGHGLWDELFGGVVLDDASPVGWVMREFGRLATIAEARWWVERYEEAAGAVWRTAQARVDPEEVTARYIAAKHSGALAILEAQPKAKGSSGAAKPTMKTEDGAAWLDKQEVPVTLGEKATWARVKDVAGCPPQSVIYAAVKLRKRRATEA